MFTQSIKQFPQSVSVDGRTAYCSIYSDVVSIAISYWAKPEEHRDNSQVQHIPLHIYAYRDCLTWDTFVIYYLLYLSYISSTYPGACGSFIYASARLMFCVSQVALYAQLYQTQSFTFHIVTSAAL